ncbi:MAG: hypothetical protein Q9191_004619 [Dirinaria sp. TL-2023a]
MAATGFKAKLAHPIHAEKRNSRLQVNEEQREKEKRFVLDYEKHSSCAEPDKNHLDIKRTVLGTASKQLRIQDFELVKTLGTGTFARVWLARFRGQTSECRSKVFALKILRKVDIIRLKQIEHIRNERNTLSTVAGHPFITTMITSFSDRECLYMILDYCPGGEIFTYLRRAKQFDPKTALFYAAEMVLIIEFLHDVKGIAYRDMKPENILLDVEGHVKLVDFGFAKNLGRKETYTLCGTPEYLAPEVIRNSGHGMAVDWWALGILIFEFIVGQPPFWDKNPMKIYEQICGGKIRFPESMDSDARDLITGLCRVNPGQRLGNLTNGTADVKNHPYFKSIDWHAVYQRKTKGPIIPEIKSATDTSCFDEYDPAPESKSVYTADMASKYDKEFKDF